MHIRTKFAAPMAAIPDIIDGEAVYKVPLTGRDGIGKFAILDPEGLETLRWAGARALYLTSDGADNSYVTFLRLPTYNTTTASRTVISAPRGRRVIYVNGNRLDLRTKNLVIEPRKDEDLHDLAAQRAAAIHDARQARLGRVG